MGRPRPAPHTRGCARGIVILRGQVREETDRKPRHRFGQTVERAPDTDNQRTSVGPATADQKQWRPRFEENRDPVHPQPRNMAGRTGSDTRLRMGTAGRRTTDTQGRRNSNADPLRAVLQATGSETGARAPTALRARGDRRHDEKGTRLGTHQAGRPRRSVLRRRNQERPGGHNADCRRSNVRTRGTESPAQHRRTGTARDRRPREQRAAPRRDSEQATRSTRSTTTCGRHPTKESCGTTRTGAARRSSAETSATGGRSPVPPPAKGAAGYKPEGSPNDRAPTDDTTSKGRRAPLLGTEPGAGTHRGSATPARNPSNQPQPRE